MLNDDNRARTMRMMTATVIKTMRMIMTQFGRVPMHVPGLSSKDRDEDAKLLMNMGMTMTLMPMIMV